MQTIAKSQFRVHHFQKSVDLNPETRAFLASLSSKCLFGPTRFFSEKRIVEDGKEYLSYAHWKKGLDKNNEVLDTPEYWRESDHFYIYESD
mgnify:CR=1 FL=1